MMLGASLGLIAAGINVLVQKEALGGDPTITIGSMAVGILGGIVGGGIGYKVKMARLVKSAGGGGGGKTWSGEYSSMDDFMRQEFQTRYAGEGGRRAVAKAPQVSAKAATRPMTIRPQPSIKAVPQVIKVKPIVDQPPMIKVPARQSIVRIKSIDSVESSVDYGGQDVIAAYNKMGWD